jgi:hypothetical protein
MGARSERRAQVGFFCSAGKYNIVSARLKEHPRAGRDPKTVAKSSIFMHVLRNRFDALDIRARAGLP